MNMFFSLKQLLISINIMKYNYETVTVIPFYFSVPMT